MQRWSKFQAIRPSGVTAASVRAASVPSVSPPTITFLTSGVVGLALPASEGTGSGMLAVSRDGSTTDAVLSGSASIRDFYSAPNNKFYVVFKTAQPVSSGGPNCILAEVNADTGNPVCIESQMTAIRSSLGNVIGTDHGVSSGNNPVQFDRAGNIYYVGTVPNNGSSSGPQALSTTLRKASNGMVTSLVTENVYIFDFVVFDDGSVLMSGITNSTGTSWIRRVSSSGALSNISATSQARFIRRFADGNVYFSMMSSSAPSDTGVRRYLTATGTVDPVPWITADRNTGSHSNGLQVCDSQNGFRVYSGFCGWSGTVVSGVFNLGNESTFVIAGQRGGLGTHLFQFFPTVNPIPVSFANITLSTQVGDKLILAGTTSAGANTMSVINLRTFQETVIIDSSNEIEVYNLSYITATNKIMFNGLRFADNTFVVGEVDLP